MRYTTIIDVTEIAEVWRNPNVSRLYFWLALKAGYHDDDRDIVRASLRSMAMATGLSLSAVRNAMKVLTRCHLVNIQGGGTMVTKFIMEQTISKRAKTKAQQEQQDAAQARREEQAKLDQQLREERRRRLQPTVEEEQERARLYEEYAKNPNSIVRKTYLSTYKTWYENYRRAH